MIGPLAHIRLSSHSVHVSLTEDHIHILKYNDRGCDYAIFDRTDPLSAGDYILELLPNSQLRVTIKGETDDWRPSRIWPVEQL